MAKARAKREQRIRTANAKAGDQLDALKRMQLMLVAHVRASGRIRIARADLEATANAKPRLAVKVQENGDLVLEIA